MNASVTVRLGVPSDTAALAAMGEKSPTSPRWQLSDYSQIFLTGRTLLIAEVQGEMAGFVVGHDLAGEWELENIVIADEFRRRGIGQRLVLELVLEARKCNARLIFLEARESNLAARKLYEKCGFEQYGRREDYYSGPSEDALLYRFLCSSGALENC